ncbi:MAG TPA: hypothetical protein VK085_09155 [Pseudogracilibacillus sp.]|nr:hypothetical protein [Pseudogracilibacillus sp.]
MQSEHEDNQAEKLQQLFAEVTNEQQQQETKNSTDFIEVDVLKLPPRSEVHQKPKRKLYIRLTSPFARLLFVFLSILIIMGVIYYVAGEQIVLFFS